MAESSDITFVAKRRRLINPGDILETYVSFEMDPINTVANSLLDEHDGSNYIANANITYDERSEILGVLRAFGFGPNLARYGISDGNLIIGVEIMKFQTEVTPPYVKCCNNINGGNEITVYLYPGGFWEGGELVVDETITIKTNKNEISGRTAGIALDGNIVHEQLPSTNGNLTRIAIHIDTEYYH